MNEVEERICKALTQAGVEPASARAAAILLAPPVVAREQAVRVTTTKSRITEAMRDELTLLSPDELAGLLKVTKDWIYDQVGVGLIPYVKMGRRLRFRASEIDAWLRGEWQPTPKETEESEEPVPLAPRRGRPRKN